MPLSVMYRKGKLEDLSKLQMSQELSATTKTIEFNTLGAGHEFWIAVDAGTIIGLTVLGRAGLNEFRIMYLEVASSHKGRGVGSSLIQTVLKEYPRTEFSVIPFEGTDEFYKRLGFAKVSRWEMRRHPPS